MPETDGQGAYEAADRVRTAIETGPLDDVGTVTVSAGACSSENTRDAETLFGHADLALYWAKDHGRNMTFLYSDEAAPPLRLTTRSDGQPPNSAVGQPFLSRRARRGLTPGIGDVRGHECELAWSRCGR